ncbi:MAG: 50S ribosomal protein L6 [Nanohaloarchaea archaeon SW_4_43_9]|nr:ribosomal protein L6 [uncultured archaeon]PSH00288.1 MAG: 50S ribosomal protein L6 [Nanohaloarchaea archaeon SW_4_43_9]
MMTMEETVELPENFEAEYTDGVLTVEEDDEKVEKKMQHALVEVEIDGNEIEFSTEETRKDIQSIVSTFRSHTENMIEGLQNEHIYKMKGVYAHFPMTIKQQSNKVLIENFMGERNPREISVEDGVTVEIDGEDLTIRGPDKDAVSQTAGKIEQACKKGNRDPRTFQDGVYITSRGEE